MDLFRKKEINLNHTSEMKKELKTSDLIMLGIGAIIGTGIFVVTGVAANQNAGPALSLSFVLAAIVVILSGLSFAEFASRVPVIGGPYAYLYVVFGEFAAWLTGWLLIGEFLLAVSSVASGWSGYMQGFLKSLGAELPQALTGGYNPENGTYIDLIAVLVVIFVTYIVSLEAKKALRLNNAMVYVKFGIIALFIIVGIFFVKPDNWQPFMPFGFSGVLDGAALVFFAFLGFDAVAMAAEEVKNPQKDVPRGIIGSILIATVLYIIVTLILTGIVPYTELGVNDPVAFAMRYVGHGTVGAVIAVGAILTLLTVTISMMYSLARLLFAVSKDGLLPKFMTEIDQKHRIPKKATYAAGVAAVFFAGFFPLNVLAELTNIMALAYLMLVSLGLLKLRKMFGKPKAGEFKVPFVPLLPIVSILTCIVLMLRLQTVTWIVFGIVMVIGLIIYFGYGYGHSKMNEK
ncbi:amino acid permease [Enterococcus faecium]|uniref:amino acid permease n=1 Tax=Enterococcus faecium TaxID=1352 RepID=UPI00157389AF|nr:amino acid permease [Enterococcus faecium]EGP5535460.1 amino acid permease [Enterococcus faecium]EMF0320634.1 amino acid permease [Enterococcus faecium]MCD5204198.1 amino acid permease [Enterococcus faecium]MCD5214340.1 amino acid permease [Enterococcus faecium]MCD5224481.1 amino acid permease [Enterococcus faecium]